MHDLGLYIVAIDLLEEELNATCSEIGSDIEPLVLDITDSDAVEEALGAVVKRLGRADVLINNAGITRDGLILRMNKKAWMMLLMSILRCLCYVAFSFKTYYEERIGRIVNISSVVGVQGNASQVNYSASKAGLLGLTKSLARELGSRNVTVNAVAPGFIETEMTKNLPEEVRKDFLDSIPLKRPGYPSDVAKAVRFLVSDDASYITGQTLLVDGGMITV